MRRPVSTLGAGSGCRVGVKRFALGASRRPLGDGGAGHSLGGGRVEAGPRGSEIVSTLAASRARGADARRATAGSRTPAPATCPQAACSSSTRRRRWPPRCHRGARTAPRCACTSRRRAARAGAGSWSCARAEIASPAFARESVSRCPRGRATPLAPYLTGVRLCGLPSSTRERARCWTTPSPGRRSVTATSTGPVAGRLPDGPRTQRCSAEMPSAGRPFTPELITALVARGIAFAPVTLHGGVFSQEAGELPHPARYAVSAATARLVQRHTRGRAHRRRRHDGRARARDGRGARRDGPRRRRLGAPRGGAAGRRAGDPRAADRLARTRRGAPAHAQKPSAAQRSSTDPTAAPRGGYRWHEFGDVHLIAPRCAPSSCARSSAARRWAHGRSLIGSVGVRRASGRSPRPPRAAAAARSSGSPATPRARGRGCRRRAQARPRPQAPRRRRRRRRRHRRPGLLGAAVARVVDADIGEIGTATYGLLRPGGRFSAYGMASGAFTRFAGKPRRGVTVGRGLAPAPERMRAGALAQAAAGRLRPAIGQTFALERAAQAPRRDPVAGHAGKDAADPRLRGRVAAKVITTP
jgi:Queuosine biosynthesis protein